jgi:hypothetical protein
VQRRRGETAGQTRARGQGVAAAEGETAKKKQKGAMAPWEERYQRETGRSPHGITNRAAFNKWIRQKRKEALEKRKATKGPSMKDAGDALAEDDE